MQTSLKVIRKENRENNNQQKHIQKSMWKKDGKTMVRPTPFDASINKQSKWSQKPRDQGNRVEQVRKKGGGASPAFGTHFERSIKTPPREYKKSSSNKHENAFQQDANMEPK